MKFLRDCFTGKDNESGDLWRVMAAFGLLSITGMQIYAIVWKGQAFDVTSTCLAYSGYLAATAAALHFKRGTEPGN